LLDHCHTRGMAKPKTTRKPDLSAAIDSVKQGLSDWAAPSRVERAYERFSRGIRKSKKDAAPVALSNAWKSSFGALVKDLTVPVKDPLFAHHALSDRFVAGSGIAQMLDDLYVPANQLNRRPDHRYNIEWTQQRNAAFIGKTSASKNTGQIQVVNVISPVPPGAAPFGSFMPATGHACVGVLFDPRYAVGQIVVTPEILYKYNYLIDHPVHASETIAKTTGSLRVLAIRYDPFNNVSQLVAETTKTLWEVENHPFGSRYEGQRAGAFNGAPLELSFTVAGDVGLAVLCIASVSVSRSDGSTGRPPEPMLCTGNLECTVPGIWIEQSRK